MDSELRVGGGAVEAVHVVVAERSVADERRDVDRRAGLGRWRQT